MSHVEQVEHVGGMEMNSHVEQVEGLKKLAGEVGQIAYGVHEYFGTGLLEKVYEAAFEHRLKNAGYKVER